MIKTYRWEHPTEAAAEGHHARLTAAGCQASVYLAYTGAGGWVVTSTSEAAAGVPAVVLSDPFTGCGAPGCAPGRPCPSCAQLLAERHTSPATLAWCEVRGHPWSTYNRDQGRTYCRCGARQDDGEHEIDLDAIWELFHDHPRGAPCSCYTRAQEAAMTR